MAKAKNQNKKFNEVSVKVQAAVACGITSKDP